MLEEKLRKIAQEEIQKQIMENLDCSIIFTYINNLEKQLEQEKEKNKELENADLTSVYLDGVYDGEKKWKDEIKAKIEYYKTIYNTVGIRALEKLLEE